MSGEIATPLQLRVLSNAVDAYCETYGIKDPVNRERIAQRVISLYRSGVPDDKTASRLASDVVAFAKAQGFPIDSLYLKGE